METVFDHKPTDEELERFGGFFDSCKVLGIDYADEKYADTNYYQIGILYSMRGNKQKTQEYFGKLKNQSFLRILWQDCP